MITTDDEKLNLIINSDAKNWREKFSFALSLPEGFIPKLDSDENVRLTLLKQPEFFTLSLTIVPNEENPSLQKIHEVELDGTELMNIIKELHIVVMTDVSSKIVSHEKEGTLSIHNNN